MIASSNVQHATPAAYSSHWPDRGNYAEIAEQQIYEGIDVVLSGGFQHLLPKESKGGKREDKEYLVNVLQSKGYAYVTSKGAMTSVGAGKLWGAFAPDLQEPPGNRREDHGFGRSCDACRKARQGLRSSASHGSREG